MECGLQLRWSQGCNCQRRWNRKDLGLDHPFTGSVELQTGEIGDDLAYYFMVSEQIASLVGVGVLVDTDLTVRSAGGILIQAMPGASDDKLARCEENAQAMGTVSDAILRHEDLEGILGLLLGENGYQVLKETDLSFACRCSRERVGAIVRAMSGEDVAACIEETGQIEARCNFCNELYVFTPSEIDVIRQEKGKVN
jgi:molecular chaperone Hsp33